MRWTFDDPVVNPADIDLWHSSTFGWDGEVVAVGDESGGGGAARWTDPTDNQGRVRFLDTATGDLLDTTRSSARWPMRHAPCTTSPHPVAQQSSTTSPADPDRHHRLT